MNNAMQTSFAGQFSNLKTTELYSVASNAENSQLRADGITRSVDQALEKKSCKNQNSILVNPKQRGNPLLKTITATPWEYDESIIPDYVMGNTTCALFLSLKYHNLKPDYINERLKQLGKLFELRVLLVQVDLDDPHHALKHLVRVCLLCDLTLMLAWNAYEAGKIIETYKVYENKPADLIMGKQESDLKLQVTNALSSIRSVNRTDAATLLSSFGSVNNIMRASKEAIALCPGIGLQKATRLQFVFKQPFLKSKSVKSHAHQKAITSFLKKS